MRAANLQRCFRRPGARLGANPDVLAPTKIRGGHYGPHPPRLVGPGAWDYYAYTHRFPFIQNTAIGRFAVQTLTHVFTVSMHAHFLWEGVNVQADAAFATGPTGGVDPLDSVFLSFSTGHGTTNHQNEGIRATLFRSTNINAGATTTWARPAMLVSTLVPRADTILVHCDNKRNATTNVDVTLFGVRVYDE